MKQLSCKRALNATVWNIRYFLFLLLSRICTRENKHLNTEFEESGTYFGTVGVRDVPNLSRYHEETETRLFLHTNHKTNEPSCTRKFIIHKPNTYVLPVWVLLRNIDGDIYIQSLIKQRSQIISSQNNAVKMKGKIEFLLHVLEYTWKDLIEAWRSLFKRRNMQYYVSHYIYEEILLGLCYDLSTG